MHQATSFSYNFWLFWFTSQHYQYSKHPVILVLLIYRCLQMIRLFSLSSFLFSIKILYRWSYWCTCSNHAVPNNIHPSSCKNSRPKLFYKNVFLKFHKFTGKHLCWSHFLIKLHNISSTGVFVQIMRNLQNFTKWLLLFLTRLFLTIPESD